MYISRVKLKNIRCFKEIEIQFDLSKEFPQWTTITGDNATGKSTLLKCMAMGLCDVTSSAGLLREIPWDLIRKDCNEESGIEIDLLGDNKEKYTVITKIVPMKKQKTEKVSREIKDHSTGREVKDDDFSWEKIFLCGYGAARGVDGTVDYLKYSTIDAVYSLFRYDQPLQNPELSMRRLVQQYATPRYSDQEDKALDWLKGCIKPLLLLDSPEDDISLEGRGGIWINRKKRGKVPLNATGDGYRAVLTWAMDFISWASLHWDNVIKTGINGIVIIDEIEQHLHPKWQRNIVPLLRKAFPFVQFITTTHSPLVAANAGKLLESDPEAKIFHLSHDGEHVQISEVEEKLGELDLDQILSSEAFDYTTYKNVRVNHILEQASILAGKGDQRTDDENRKYEIFLSELKQLMFPVGGTLIERHAAASFYKEIEDNIEKFRKILEG